jgi:hypothetical protein
LRWRIRATITRSHHCCCGDLGKGFFACRIDNVLKDVIALATCGRRSFPGIALAATPAILHVVLFAFAVRSLMRLDIRTRIHPYRMPLSVVATQNDGEALSHRVTICFSFWQTAYKKGACATRKPPAIGRLRD